MTPNDKKNINANILDPDPIHKKNTKKIIKTTKTTKKTDPNAKNSQLMTGNSDKKTPKKTDPNAKNSQLMTGNSDKKGNEAEANIDKKSIDTKALKRKKRDIWSPVADNKKDKNTTLTGEAENRGISTTKTPTLKKEDKFNGCEKPTRKKPKKCNKTSKNKSSSMPRKGNTK
jgi:hypothetical protein